MAKNTGKVFEDCFKNSITPDIYFYRLRDSGSSFGAGNQSLRFTVKNDYDCFLYKKPNFFPCELKSTQGTSFSIQAKKEESGKNIKLNQIDGLTNASKFQGVYSGFILNFRSNQNHTYWLNIIDFNRFNITTDKKSINEKDVKDFNGIEIRNEIKKVKYTYFINELLEKIKLLNEVK